MAVTAKIYPMGLVAAYDGDVSVGDHIIKCALLTSSYSPSYVDQNWLVVDDYEISAPGYTAGGALLSDITLTLKAGTDTFRFWASECLWSDSTITARYAVIYDSTSGYLLSYVDFGEDKSSVGGTFKVDFDDTEGIFQIST